jgi:AcrR family transcriptional regulator
VERALVTTLERLIPDEPRFTDLNLARLVGEAGVSRTSFYKYFDSKIDVLSVWLTEAVELLMRTPRAWSGPGAPSRDELTAGMRSIAGVYRPRMPLIAAVYEITAHDADLRAQLADTLGDLEDALTRHIARGQREGWINAALEPAESAGWLMCMAENGLRHILGPAPDRQVPKLVDAWADTVWFTLYAPAAAT